MKYLTRSEINTEKWDTCVAHSVKPLIYGVSWFLDAATNQQWDGLVWGDYEAVMPLPINDKIFYKSIARTPLLQQLGPYGKIELVHQNFTELKKLLRRKVKTYTLPLSIINEEGKKTVNQVLPLHDSYEELYKNFRKDRKYDSRKSSITTINLSEQPEVFLNFSKQESKSRAKETRLAAIVNACLYKNAGEIFGIIENKNLISAVFLSHYKQRITLLCSVTSKVGFKKRANSALLFHVIRQYANSDYTLDFEGSEIPGVQDFFSSFGAKIEPYFVYSYESTLLKNIKKGLRK